MDTIYPCFIFEEGISFKAEDLRIAKIKRRDFLPSIPSYSICYEFIFHDKKLYIDLLNTFLYDEKVTGNAINTFYVSKVESLDSVIFGKNVLTMDEIRAYQRKLREGFKFPFSISQDKVNSTFYQIYELNDFKEGIVDRSVVEKTIGPCLKEIEEIEKKEIVTFRDNIFLVEKPNGNITFVEKLGGNFYSDFFSEETISKEELATYKIDNDWEEIEPYPYARIDFSRAFRVIKKINQRREEKKTVKLVKVNENKRSN